MDYSTISQASNAQSCGSDSLSGGQYTLCGLFNNTLSGHTYSGAYGTVPGANNTAPYKADFKSINPEGFLIYSLADGSMVGFNPELSGCGVTAGTLIDNELLTGKLSKCLGFIDVNGVNPPNAEITCADGTTELNPSKICEIKSIGSTTGDIYPVVFHDGTVAPATNAAMSALLGDKAAKDESATAETPKELTPEEKLAKRRDFSKWELQRITTPMSKADCEAKKESLGIKACGRDNDYWAAAVEKCGGVQNLPTEDDLYELAKKVYPTCFDSNKYCHGTPDLSQLPESLSGLGSSWYFLWSGSEDSADRAYYWRFYNGYSAESDDNRVKWDISAVCVGDLEK